MASALNIQFPGNLAQVDSANELRRVPSSFVTDGALYLVTDLGGIYEFDTSSSAADDGAEVIRPSDRTVLQAGRWIKNADGLGRGAAGDTGPADNTYTTLAALLASPGSRKSARLVPQTGEAEPAGNFAYIGGAWVRQIADGITTRAVGAMAVVRDVQTKLRETVSVLDYYQPTDTDFTAAFNRANATGKAVFVPILAGGYPVNGITVISNMQIVGEKSGECLGPELVVTVNGGCVFLQPATTNIAVHLLFRDFTMRAAAGVTGAAGFRSADKSKYSAYVTFENIETHRNLVWGYDLLPIYTDWINCRDGYLPGIGGFTMVHGFIKAEAATYGQTNATNTNNVIRPKVFGCYGVDAAIQIAFGDDWNIIGGRWENMFTPAVKAQSVSGLRMIGNRTEGMNTTEWLTLLEMSSSGVGTSADVIDNIFTTDAANFLYARTDAISRVGFERCRFSIIGPGQKLVNNPLALLYNRDHPTISGAGAAGLMVGMQHDRRIAGQYLANGAAPNTNMALTSLNLGGSAATQGFGSGNAPVTIGADWVSIFTPASSVGLAAVAGIETNGTQHFWPVGFTVGQAAASGNAITSVGVVAEFRKNGGDLQMRCTTGGVTVTASALVAA